MTAQQQQRQRLHEQLRYDLDTTIGAALTNPQVTEIKVGSDGRVWLREHSRGWVDTETQLTAHQAARVLSTVADLLGTHVTAARPLLQGELPLTGDRFQGWVPPIVTAPSFVIRRHAPAIYPLSDYEAQGILAPWQCDALRSSIAARHNIVVSGATDSGKTTLVNALLHAITEDGDSGEHIVILEDTAELQCAARNVLHLHTSEPEVPLRALVRTVMRARPDRIIVGETRDGAALDLLKAWNTGHKGGITTLHANSAADVLLRLDMLCLEAGLQHPVPLLVQSAIDRIVHIEMTPQGRRVTDIVDVPPPAQHTVIPVVPLHASDHTRTNGTRASLVHHHSCKEGPDA